MPISDLSTLHSDLPPSWILSTKADVQTSAAEDWSTLAARIAGVPSTGTIRGMFMRQACANVPGLSSARYLPFTNYSLRDYMAALLKAAAARFPDERPADALVRLGLDVYSLFAATLAGSTIFGMANNAFRHVIELAPRAYPVTLSPGQVTVVRCDASSAWVELREVWPFPDYFHAGIWLGAMKVCRAEGTIAVTQRSASAVDFFLQWTPGLN